ncbi:F-box protein At5g41720 [Linum grandiflorum]
MASPGENQSENLSSTVELPFDAVSEIITRCSLPTVAKFRTTSRDFNTHTYESHFRQLHLCRTAAVSGFLCQRLFSNRFYRTFIPNYSSSSSGNIDLGFLKHPARVLASAGNQGVIVYETEERLGLPRYNVAKPATNQRVPLPNPKTRYFTRSVGILVLGSGSNSVHPVHHNQENHPPNLPCQRSVRFKIVRLSDPKWSTRTNSGSEVMIRCEVFDSEVWRWKLLEGNTTLLRPGEFIESGQPITTCGSLHWLTSSGNVMSFHGDSERWESFGVPNRFKRILMEERGVAFSVRLVEYEGKLGLLCMDRSRRVVELWALEKYGERAWEMRFSIDTSVLNERSDALLGSPLGFRDADTILFNGWHNIFMYNFKIGEVEDSNSIVDAGWEVFPFYSDFEMCDFGRPEKKATCSRKPRGKKVDGTNR